MNRSSYVHNSAQTMLRRCTLLFVFLLLITPSFAQDDGQINKVSLDISCVNTDGDEVNSGLGTLTVSGEPTIILKDDATAAECAGLGAQLLLSQLDEAMIIEMMANMGIDIPQGPIDDPEPPEEDDGDDDTPEIILGTPVGPADNFERECDNREATFNGVRIQAFLPAGSYRAVLLPTRFQTFDPILFVATDSERICSSESSLAREYVLDFSRADIGGQVYGHNSGGTLEFEVAGSSTELSPVEIIVGGQDRSDAGTSGEFVLIIEGARLSPQASQHVYNVTMTESLFLSDVPLSVIVLGVDNVIDPNLQAGVLSSDGAFTMIFECEDSGDRCDSDNRRSLEDSSVVEAAVRTVSGDDLDTALVKQPGAYLSQGVQDVSFIVSEVRDDTLSREEYVIVFHGGID